MYNIINNWGGKIMDWNSSALWGLIGLIGGFFVSCIFFYLSKKKRKLSYSITTTPIVVQKISKISDLIISYKNKDIDNLSVSKLIIKNIGNETLEPKDFPELNKLSLTTDGQFLIDSIDELEIETSNKYTKLLPNLISINKIEITFDFLDPKDTIFCNVFHTGNINICGTIKNGKIIHIDNNNLDKIVTISKKLEIVTTILASILGILVITIAHILNK